MEEQLELASDAGKPCVVMEGFLEREIEGERAEVLESLRAELLNDPRTLVQLPCIRERLYKMSFTAIKLEDSAPWFLSWQDAMGMGGENFFQALCDETLNIAKSLSMARWKFLQRCVKDTTYYYLVGLDILVPKVCKHLDRAEIFCSSFIDSAYYNLYIDLRINPKTLYDDKISSSNLERDCDREESTCNTMVVAALVVLLFCVCQFLMLFEDRGRGSRSYSSGSLDFSDVYVSIVLFRGAYVWIKFRQAATSQTSLKRKSCEAQDHVPGVYRREVKNTSGIITHYKYEPRFKPRREKLDSGATLQFHRLSLGEYDTPGEAKIVLQIAAFYYGAKDAGDWVALEDGSFFVIPAMDEHEKRLSGLSKAKWVTDRAKKVFKELHPESGVTSRKLSWTPNAGVGLDVADPVGSGPHEPTPAPEFLGVQQNVPEMENDASESGRHDSSAGHDGEATVSARDQQVFDELWFGSNILSQAESGCVGLVSVFEILGDASIPQSDNAGAAQEFVGIPNPNCAQGVESVGAVHDDCTVTNVSESDKEGDLEPLVSRQKELLQKHAIRNAVLEHQLLEAEVKISELRRDNERLRAAKAQEAAAAKSQVGTWLADFVIDFPSENGR